MDNTNQDDGMTFQRMTNMLGEIPFFDGFSPEELDFFSTNMSLRSIPEGTCLFKKGDIGDYLFFIVNGKAEIRLDSSHTAQIVIATFGPGSTVGEMAVMDEHPRSATVIMIEPSEVLMLTRKRFDAVCKESPQVGLKFMRNLAKNLSVRLRRTTGRFADLS